MAGESHSVPLGEWIELRKGVSYKGEFLDRPGPRLLGLGTIVLGGGIMLEKAAPYGGPIREHQRASAGDLLLAVVGITPVGSVIGSPALIPFDAQGDFAFTHHVAKVRVRHKADLDLRFLYYVFRDPAFHAFVWQMQSGSTVPEIALDDVLAYEIRLPLINEQRAIAHILRTLDDKIELNRRMSEILEEMASALFKSWFVDFDPVRAKAEGRDPGLPKPLADLFPARLVDSELSEIPEGWGVGCFSTIGEFVRENVNPQDSPDTAFQHFSIPAFDEGQWPANEFGAAIKSSKSRVPPGAVLLSKLNPEIERVWLVDVDVADRAICSTEFLVVRPRPPAGRSYLYCFAQSLEFRQALQGLVTGTSKSHQRAQAASILALPSLGPPVGVAEAFEHLAGPLLERSIGCRRESRTLAALRDTLLPKLISGELRVEDAERFLARVG